ncbi:MAG: hypothetical protein J0M34_08885 [Alphaproteobacteria bacterium]|nr:hypothetical protein [Alphaproteobacteria bacterium]
MSGYQPIPPSYALVPYNPNAAALTVPDGASRAVSVQSANVAAVVPNAPRIIDPEFSVVNGPKNQGWMSRTLGSHPRLKAAGIAAGVVTAGWMAYEAGRQSGRSEHRERD